MAEEVKKRKKAQEEADEAPSWLMTYGDMMILLLTFFVLLISFSSIQQTKFEMALGSLKASLGVLTGGRSTSVDSKLPLLNVTTIPRENFMISLQRILSYIEEADLKSGLVEMEVTNQGILFRISNNLLFRLGKADLLPSTRDFLVQISDLLKKMDGYIRVEGHTCDLPIHTAEFPSNWELSAKRAINVIKFFHEQNVPPERLSAIGYGEFRPIVSNDGEANRSKNRRVEIYLEFQSSEPDYEMVEVLNNMIEPVFN